GVSWYGALKYCNWMTLAQEMNPSQRCYAEGPAGAIQHRLILENGRIAHLSIISSSTWNGAPSDERNQTGPIEMALKKGDFDLNRISDQLPMSRVVHSFAFSMSDAVH
ncbi:MAG: nickel-dependent hydrogenase large subunit, partial [bacterium]